MTKLGDQVFLITFIYTYTFVLIFADLVQNGVTFQSHSVNLTSLRTKTHSTDEKVEFFRFLKNNNKEKAGKSSMRKVVDNPVKHIDFE